MAAEARRGAGDGREPGFPVERSRTLLACGFHPGPPSASPCPGCRGGGSQPAGMSLTRTTTRTIGPRTFTPSASTAQAPGGGDSRWPRWERPSVGNPPPCPMEWTPPYTGRQRAPGEGDDGVSSGHQRGAPWARSSASSASMSRRGTSNCTEPRQVVSPCCARSSRARSCSGSSRGSDLRCDALHRQVPKIRARAGMLECDRQDVALGIHIDRGVLVPSRSPERAAPADIEVGAAALWRPPDPRACPPVPSVPRTRPPGPATGHGGSTVRPHVKHMFTRHGLSRQADLVRLVLSPGSAPESRR